MPRSADSTARHSACACAGPTRQSTSPLHHRSQPHEPPRTAPSNPGDTMSMVKRPTIEQLQKIVAIAAHEHVGRARSASTSTCSMARCRPTTASTQLPDYLPRGALPAHAGDAPARRPRTRSAPGAVKSRGAGRAVRPAGRQARRAEGQRLPGRRADDERRFDARRLRARRRRHASSRASSMPAAPSSARRTANTSASPAAATPSALGPGAQPVQASATRAGGSSSRLRRAGRRRRGRDGDRRRPGRLDPHAGVVLAAATA